MRLTAREREKRDRTNDPTNREKKKISASPLRFSPTRCKVDVAMSMRHKRIDVLCKTAGWDPKKLRSLKMWWEKTYKRVWWHRIMAHKEGTGLRSQQTLILSSRTGSLVFTISFHWFHAISRPSLALCLIYDNSRTLFTSYLHHPIPFFLASSPFCFAPFYVPPFTLHPHHLVIYRLEYLRTSILTPSLMRFSSITF